ncbi:MAG: hypothetical protein OJF61_001382 [Rhodanobacteraceae bacterium]|nr:MAG: hypothetical protein OJF61_001382 [Rhodanobacteraceae bacterium]
MEGEGARLADAGGIGCASERTDMDVWAGATHHGWFAQEENWK